MSTRRLTALHKAATNAGMNPINDAAQNITDRLTWHTANRDQAGIAQNLADGQDILER